MIKNWESRNGDENDLVLCLLISENKKEKSSIHGRCETALFDWYDVYHWWQHIFCSQRIPGSEIQVCHVISSTMILAYMTSLTLRSQSKAAPILCLLHIGQAAGQGTTSQQSGTGLHSMACEVLPQGKCKPVFLDMQILAGKQDFKWPPKQHCDQYSKWQHYPGLLN